ncbi:hypothetical protein [Streptomyces jumonjinensis]|uniref:Uncharacterized protein n=1 Tax=Streptomyces jumonjinensis TaxID=1945 RepID=A0A646KT27_STRJU|nr:hypothetical protein [Streptomyces jumonjinensis]MQT05187.1 hypothetical protein [Streptomyces jumonjinensis]
MAGAGDPHGAVIASNGGDVLFVADRIGPIHRTPASPDAAEFDEIAGDLPQFLDHIRRCVLGFMETGTPPGDLLRVVRLSRP